MQLQRWKASRRQMLPWRKMPNCQCNLQTILRLLRRFLCGQNTKICQAQSSATHQFCCKNVEEKQHYLSSLELTDGSSIFTPLSNESARTMTTRSMGREARPPSPSLSTPSDPNAGIIALAHSSNHHPSPTNHPTTPWNSMKTDMLFQKWMTNSNVSTKSSLTSKLQPHYPHHQQVAKAQPQRRNQQSTPSDRSLAHPPETPEQHSITSSKQGPN